nr:MAG TPA: integrase [Bacteriophage sp.]
MANRKWRPACYCRVSTIHQIDKESIPTQVHLLSNYCAGVLGCKKEDIKFYIDAGYSGKNTKRPEYEKMIEDVKAGRRNVVVAYKLDRISRNLIDFAKFLESLKEHGAEFISLSESFDTSSVMGRGMLKLIALFAEMERGITRERVMAVSKDIISRGGHLGAPTPLGYDYDKATKKYSINEKEAETVRWIFKTAGDGESTTYISNYLNDHNITGKRSGYWTSTTVFHILHNPAYTGKYVWNRRSSGRYKLKDKSEWLTQEKVYPVIIPAAEWQSVQDKLAARRKGKNVKRAVQSHLFLGLLSCALCGHDFRARKDKARADGYRPSVYSCPAYTGHAGCTNGHYYSDMQIAPLVTQYIENVDKLANMQDLVNSRADLARVLLFNMPDVVQISNIDTLYGLYGRTNQEPVPENIAMVRAFADAEKLKADKELEKYYKALDRLKDLYLFGDANMSKEDYVTTRGKIESKIAAVISARDETTREVSPRLDVDAKKYGPILKLLRGNVGYKMIGDKVGFDLLAEFFHDVLSGIVVDKSGIVKIIFKNGVAHCLCNKETGAGVVMEYPRAGRRKSLTTR